MIDKIKILLLYSFCFAILFLKIPLHGYLPGKTDCWWHLAVFSDFENRLYAFIHHLPVATSYFPSKALWLYGEPSFGVGAIYAVIHFVVNNYIWSFYLLYVFLFSFTAIAFYFLAGQFISARLPRFAGGLFFTLANFALGQFDHHNVFFWGIALLTILFLHIFLNTSKILFLYLFFFLWGIQIYFSTTIFTYLTIWVIVLLLINFQSWFKISLLTHFAVGGIFSLLLVSPFLLMYLGNPQLKLAYNPSIFANGHNTSNLWLVDWIRFLPSNICHASLSDIDFDLLYNIKCVAPGIVLLLLFFLGCKRLSGKLFLSLAILGILLSAGSEVKLGSWIIPMPMKLFYLNFPDSPLLQTPIRAYFLVHWVLCMGAVFGIQNISKRTTKGWRLACVATLLFLLENVPIKFPSTKADEIIFEGVHLAGFLQAHAFGDILHLPSQTFPKFPIEKSALGVNAIGREYIYSFWQTMYKKNSPNGSAHFFPKPRVELNECLQLGSAQKFYSQLIKYNIQFVLFHDNFLLQSETYIKDSLTSYSFLKPEITIGSTEIFSVKEYEGAGAFRK
jgi:hypothetical protein